MYKYLSACYDLFMSDVDYDAWVRKIVRCLGGRKKGIDCGCGSGKITAGLTKAGYDVTGADISSRYKLVEIIGNNVFTDSADDVTYIWANHLSAKKDKVEMFLTFFTRNADGSYAKREENQVQYVYDAEYLAELLRGAGFADVSYDYFDGKITPETEERIFFTAYKGGIK